MSASLWSFAAIVTAFKLLLIPSYRSTDFEVHRNWLAITHSLPIKQWYRDTTSQWTLDYPPLFAWFEYAMSHVAALFDANMLVVANLNYASYQTIVFQRLSVITTDLLYIYAAIQFSTKFVRSTHQRDSKENWEWLEAPPIIMGILLIANIGLTIVDHIHFQYNGFLLGVFLLSLVRIYQGRNNEAALLFAVLLNLKHIYLYVAPAYFIYLLRSYVFTSRQDGSLRVRSFSPLRLLSLAFVVCTVFVASLYPFSARDDMQQLLRRLFPFKRGLCHAYWAPNFWALYNLADKALLLAGRQCGLLGEVSATNASMTGGLVQQYDHSVLPSITPSLTLVITLLGMLPCLVHLWLLPAGVQGFLHSLVVCAFTSFMFGWHVHEKAILLVVIPLTLTVLQSKNFARIFLLLTTVGHFSLFPLLFTKFEIPLKILLWILFCLYAFSTLSHYYRDSRRRLSLPLMSPAETIYLLGLVVLEAYKLFVHDNLPFSARYSYLPLLMTSAYCAVGVTYCWVALYYFTLTHKQRLKLKKS